MSKGKRGHLIVVLCLILSGPLLLGMEDKGNEDGSATGELSIMPSYIVSYSHDKYQGKRHILVEELEKTYGIKIPKSTPGMDFVVCLIILYNGDYSKFGSFCPRKMPLSFFEGKACGDIFKGEICGVSVSLVYNIFEVPRSKKNYNNMPELLTYLKKCTKNIMD